MANFYSYGSNSKGNCYLLEFNNFNVVLDIGIDAFSKIKDHNFLKWDQVRYLLISHEHNDHTRYLKKFIETFNNCEIVINPKCYDVLIKKDPNLHYFKNRFIFVNYSESYVENKKNFFVKTFKVNHSSVANNGYLISIDNKKIVYITDCGSLNVDKNLITMLNKIDLFLLESNYLETLEDDSNLSLKEQRQFSLLGHFSRKQSYDFIKKILFQNEKCQFCFIHTSFEKYTFAVINDFLYDELKIKHKRIKPIGYDEFLNF